MPTLYQVSTMLFRCSSEVSNSGAVDEFSTVRVVFAQVHSGPCCAIEHEVGGVGPNPRVDRISTCNLERSLVKPDQLVAIIST